MVPKRRRMGMFDHAKYSRPVLRNVPDSVLTAIKKDVDSLFNLPAASTREIPSRRQSRGNNDNNVMTGNGSESNQRISILPPMPMNSFKPASLAFVANNGVQQAQQTGGQQQQYLPVETAPTFSQVRDALLNAGKPHQQQQATAQRQTQQQKSTALLPPTLMQYVRRNMPAPQLPTCFSTSYSSMQHYNVDRMLATTPQQPNNKEDRANEQRAKSAKRRWGGDDDEEGFPEKPPCNRFANRIKNTHPSVTLRTKEPMTLLDASFALFRGALASRHSQAACVEAEANAEEDGREQRLAEELNNIPLPLLSPFRTISNQTLAVQEELGDAGANHTRAFSSSSSERYLEESPVSEDEEIFKSRKRAPLPSTGTYFGGTGTRFTGDFTGASYNSAASRTVLSTAATATRPSSSSNYYHIPSANAAGTSAAAAPFGHDGDFGYGIAEGGFDGSGGDASFAEDMARENDELEFNTTLENVMETVVDGFDEPPLGDWPQTGNEGRRSTMAMDSTNNVINGTAEQQQQNGGGAFFF